MVEQTLAGRGDRLKAYELAVAVLERDASFNPQNDPIVRIEMAQLRRDLDHYYLTDGHADPSASPSPKATMFRNSRCGTTAQCPRPWRPRLQRGGSIRRNLLGWRKAVAAGLCSAPFGRRCGPLGTVAGQGSASGRACVDRRAVPGWAGLESHALRRPPSVRRSGERQRWHALAVCGRRSACLCGDRRRATWAGPSANRAPLLDEPSAGLDPVTCTASTT